MSEQQPDPLALCAAAEEIAFGCRELARHNEFSAVWLEIGLQRRLLAQSATSLAALARELRAALEREAALRAACQSVVDDFDARYGEMCTFNPGTDEALRLCRAALAQTPAGEK